MCPEYRNDMVLLKLIDGDKDGLDNVNVDDLCTFLFKNNYKKIVKECTPIYNGFKLVFNRPIDLLKFIIIS